jgi:hypothetical protein
MPILDIGEVAQRSGVPASTLRYYEEIGLIGSLGHLECPTFRGLLKSASQGTLVTHPSLGEAGKGLKPARRR